MKKLVGILLITCISLGGISCVKGKKSCKASHKRVKKMRKSGQIQF